MDKETINEKIKEYYKIKSFLRERDDIGKIIFTNLFYMGVAMYSMKGIFKLLKNPRHILRTFGTLTFAFTLKELEKEGLIEIKPKV